MDVHNSETWRSASRLMNTLILHELPPPAEPEIAEHRNLSETLDIERLEWENNIDFLRFELASIGIFEASSQIDVDSPHDEGAEPEWIIIENEICDNQLEDQTPPSKEPTGFASGRRDYQSQLDVVEEIANSGSMLHDMKGRLVPNSLSALRRTVEKISTPNKSRKESICLSQKPIQDSNPRTPVIIDETDLINMSRADELYDLLSTCWRDCDSHVSEHHVYFGVLDLIRDCHSQPNEVFNILFATPCSVDIRNEPERRKKKFWHNATCTFNVDNRLNPKLKIRAKICSETWRSRQLQVPLELSFNRENIWLPRRGSALILPNVERTGQFVPLSSVLNGQCLKANNLDDAILKFRLALRLAWTMCHLYPGKWIQQHWTSSYIHIHIGDGPIVDLFGLDKAYIPCSFPSQTPETLRPILSNSDHDICPMFFLSFAQLLLDIVKGEGERIDDLPPTPELWYELLADEVRKGQETSDANMHTMDFYWKAVSGALTYLDSYRRESQWSKDEITAARKVIYDTIVRNLKEQLKLWEIEDISAPRDSHTPNRFSQTPSLPDNSTDGRATFILWSDGDEEYVTTTMTHSTNENSFSSYMSRYIEEYIETLPEPAHDGGIGDPVRVAIIDSGISLDEEDMDPFFQNPMVRERIIIRRNFCPSDATESTHDAETHTRDKHGHGTHVARLLLRFAPRAEVYIAKITNSRSLKVTRKQQLLEALKWAGQHADIINLSFGLRLGEASQYKDLRDEIERLVKENKLIFAAASNTGGNGSRPWPASQLGVFCMHAANERGNSNIDINPSPDGIRDNFSTLGHGVDSFWKGEYRSISGTSYATPIGAAIAANVLEFARRKLPADVANYFNTYGGMRDFFRKHMVSNSSRSVYHYLTPWKEGLWDGVQTPEQVADKLSDIRYGIAGHHQEE